MPPRPASRSSAAAPAGSAATLRITSVDAIRQTAATASLTASGIVGVPFVYQIVASNSPSAYLATGLPDGLVLNPGTSLISGLPATAGTYPITLSANNLAGTGPAIVLTLTVSPNNGTPNPTPVVGAHLVNLSSRAAVGTGDNVLIVGFVITGTVPKPVIIRGIGPALAAAPFNMAGTLPDPVFDLYHSGTVINQNDNWGSAGDGATISAIATAVGAFPLPSGSKDAALLTVLQPGVYSVIIAGVGNTTGIALVEIYEVGN